MKISRKTASLVLTAAALPLVLSSVGGNASASSWTPYKIQTGGGTEPGIDIGFDSDGKEIVYVHTTNGAPLHNRAWYYQPGQPGFNLPVFKEIAFGNPYGKLPGGGDADIAMRGDDLWFIDLWLGSNSIQYSPDKGKTWTVGTPFTTLPLSDRQWVSLGETVTNPTTGATTTTVYVTYQIIGAGTWIARSRDNGLSWDFHAPVRETPGATGVSGPPIHIVSAGKTVVLGVHTSNGYEVAVSKNEGVTWDIGPVSSDPSLGKSSLVGLTMNPENEKDLAVIYPSGRFPRGKVVINISRDGGKNWTAPIRPLSFDETDPQGGTGGDFDTIDWFPWIDWRGNKIAAAWYQSTHNHNLKSPDDLPTANKWNIYYSEAIEEANGEFIFSTPEQVGDKAAKSGAICTQGLACERDRDLGDFMQLAIDTSGKSWIVVVHASGTPGFYGTGIMAYKQG